MAISQSGIPLKLLRYFFIAIIPFIYLISPYLVLIPICMICLIYKYTLSKKNESAFAVIFLFVTLFSGIAFLGIRLYDWAIIFGAIELFFNRQRIRVRLSVFAFFFSVILVFLFNYHDYSVMALARYFFSLMLLIILMNKKTNLFPTDGSIFYDIIISCIYFAIAIFLFTQMGLLHDIDSGIVTTNVYIFTKEARMNGFFSDPNKYMSFVFILAFIVERFWRQGKLELKILCVSLAAIFSLSRTSILVLMLFFFGRSILRTKKYQVLLKSSVIAVGGILALLVVAFPDSILELGNDFFTWSSEILGREQTLKQNQSLSDDNRILIWTSAMYFISQAPLLGHGWLSFKDLLPYPTHNTILSLLLDGGIFALGSSIFLFKDLLFNKYWPIIFPLIIIPLVTLDLSDYRMEFFLLGVLWNEEMHLKNAKSANN